MFGSQHTKTLGLFILSSPDIPQLSDTMEAFQAANQESDVLFEALVNLPHSWLFIWMFFSNVNEEILIALPEHYSSVW